MARTFKDSKNYRGGWRENQGKTGRQRRWDDEDSQSRRPQREKKADRRRQEAAQS